MNNNRPADNRISLQKLEVFCAVVEAGGVGAAAEKLYISQPVVSAHLRSLQQRVGAQLIERNGRGISLTEAGREVFVWASDVLRSRNELDKNLQDLSGGTAGSVSIGASMSVGNTIITPLLIDFRGQHPDVRLSLSISDVESALDGVLHGHFDFATVATDAVFDADLFEAELVARPSYALFASALNTTIPDEIAIAELSKLPFVAPPTGQAIRRSQDSALASIGVQNRTVVIELGSGEAIKQAVAADSGAALLWRHSIRREMRAGILREVRIRNAHLSDMLFIVKRKAKILSPSQRRLREALVTGIPELLAEDASG